MDIPLLNRYQRLIDITLDLASVLDLGTLLNRITQIAAELSDAQAASILLYDESEQQLHFEAATYLDEPLMRGLVVPVEGSITGWIVKNQQAVIVNDTSKDPRFFPQIGEQVNYQTKSMLGVPLINKAKVIGVLEALNKQSGQFDGEDQAILDALAAQASVAIENARLFQQSDLVSELVHELRTPLASINTAAHLILRPEVSEEQRNRMVHVIQSETYRLTEMTTSYLDLAQLESGRAQFHAETFDPSALMEECVNVMNNRAAEKGLDLFLEIQNGIPLITADRNKIKQVVLNLISNAIKYNTPGGKIWVVCQAQGDELCFSVKDTGVGIRPENQAQLFEKFYRVPGSDQYASGTGLGLSICKRIIDAHRGKIQVYSEAGVGTTFTVRLPFSRFPS